MASGEHSENLRLIALEARDLKETVCALRSEIEKAHRDCDARLQDVIDAANTEILHLRGTIRRLRESLDASQTSENGWADTGKETAEVFPPETAVRRTRIEREQSSERRDNCDQEPLAEYRSTLLAAVPEIEPTGPIVDCPLSPNEGSVQRASPVLDGELAELRETIVRLRERLDNANVAWDQKMKAIESAGRSKRRELEETIKILRERLQKASAKG